MLEGDRGAGARRRDGRGVSIVDAHTVARAAIERRAASELHEVLAWSVCCRRERLAGGERAAARLADKGGRDLGGIAYGYGAHDGGAHGQGPRAVHSIRGAARCMQQEEQHRRTSRVEITEQSWEVRKKRHEIALHRFKLHPKVCDTHDWTPVP